MRSTNASKVGVLIVSLAALFAACDASITDKLGDLGKLDELKGKHIGAFPVEPPVTAVTPSSLLTPSAAPFAPAAFALAATANPTVIDTIKARFFTPGPTYVKNILAAIDGRVQDVDMRAASAPHACQDDAPQASAVTSPALAFTQYFSCVTSFGNTNDNWVAFGVKDGVFSIRTSQDVGLTSMANVVTGGTVEAWIGVADKDHVTTMTQALMHLKASESQGVLEFTVTGNGTGVGCGVQYRSNASYIWLYGQFGDPDSPSPCASVPVEQICLNTADLTQADDSACQSAGLDQFELPALGPSFVAPENIYKLAEPPPANVRDFAEVTSAATAPRVAQ